MFNANPATHFLCVSFLAPRGTLLAPTVAFPPTPSLAVGRNDCLIHLTSPCLMRKVFDRSFSLSIILGRSLGAGRCFPSSLLHLRCCLGHNTCVAPLSQPYPCDCTTPAEALTVEALENGGEARSQ
ncbi:hypothetical protein XANCAGTX0491_006323 [Xanthoria calcicola]